MYPPSRSVAHSCSVIVSCLPSFVPAGGTVDADAEGVVEISPSSSSSTASSGIAGGKYVLKLDIIGNPMRVVAVPTHFFKVRPP